MTESPAPCKGGNVGMSVPRGKQTRRGGNALQEEGGVRRRGLCLLKRIITTVPLGREEGGRGRGVLSYLAYQKFSECT